MRLLRSYFHHLRLLTPFLLVCVSVISCAPSAIRSRTASSTSLAPTSVTLTTDLPLLYVYTTLALGDTPALGGSTPAFAGATIANAGSTPALAGGSPAIAGSSPSISGNTANDATASYTITADVGATFPSTATQRRCSVLSPFQSLDCSAFHFMFSNTNIATSGSFQVSAYDGSAPTQTTFSNSLSARILELKQLSNIQNNQATNDNPHTLTSCGSYVYFIANNSNGVSKYFRINSSDTITQVANVANNNAGEDWAAFGSCHNDELYFRSTNQNNAIKLYKSDSAGTVSQISNFRSNQNTNDNIAGFNPVSFNNELYVIGDNASGSRKMMKIVAGVATQISNTSAAQANTDNVNWMHVFNNELFFSAYNVNNVYKMFKADTAGTLTQVSNLRNDQSLGDDTTDYVNFNGALYFRGKNSNGVSKVFKYITGGTITQISNTRGNQAADDFPSYMRAAHGNLYFRAHSSNGVYKIFKIDSSDTVTQVTNTRNNQAQDDSPNGAVVFDSDYYFSSQTGAGVYKLFRIDSSGRVSQVTNINGAGTDGIGGLTTHGTDSLYFIATNTSGGSKLFKLRIR